MRKPTFTRPARAAVLTSIAALAAWMSASAAHASTQVDVKELQTFGGPLKRTVTDNGAKTVSLSGNLTNDLHLTNTEATGTSFGSAGAGRLSVSTDLRAASSNIAFGETDITTRFTDFLTLKGLADGQKVTLHQTLHLTGGDTVTETQSPPGASSLAEMDLDVTGSGVQIGPFFGAFDGPTYATVVRSNPSDRQNDRDLGGPRDIDLLLTLVGGHTNLFSIGMELHSAMESLGGSGRLAAHFDLTWSGGGFLTLDDAAGNDTGRRVGSGVSLQAQSGFDFLGGSDTVGGGASGAPEPAAWALLIVGFGFAGSALRRRRVAAA
jgi:hypothetical protein